MIKSKLRQLLRYLGKRYSEFASKSSCMSVTSLIITTTNLDFGRWAEVFADLVLTGALLDRLTHHSHILLFEGESYRFKQRTQHS